jgi:RHS repeat-associated protein
VYDAWNRLVRVTNTAGTTTHVAYAHDALGRRVCIVTGAPAANPCQTTGGTTTDLYYSDSWQVLEEKVGTTTKVQYVWSPVYVDAMILRDRDANGTPGDGPYGSNLEQRLYVQHDANFNVTALVDTSGTAVERYVYDPYGTVTYLTESWGSRGSSEYAWVYLHQGGRYDDNAKLYHFRNRDLSPTLGRWMQNDPLGYAAGDTNLFRYLGSSPTNRLDASGLAWDPLVALGELWGGWGKPDPSRPITRPYDENSECKPGGPALGDVYGRGKDDFHSTKRAFGPTMVGGAVFAAGLVLPGPDDVIMGQLLLKYGYRVLTQGGKKVYAKITGQVISDAEARDLLRQWKIASKKPHWSMEGADKVIRHGTHGKFYRDPATGLWWTKDTAQHGGSVWKVYKQDGNKMIWFADADEFGDFIIGKHKGSTGKSIPIPEFSGI